MVREKMWHSLVRIAIILAFFQCVQGVVRHFDTNRRSEKTEYSFHRSRSDSEITFDGIPQPRARRQGTGGEPYATSSLLPNDRRQFGRISYSGEGSKVLYVLTYNLARRSNRVTSSALYRSVDYGQTFQNQASKLRLGFLLNPSIYRYSSDNGIAIFTEDARRVIYVSTDEGETFRAYDIPVDQRTLKLHPTMVGWMLGHDPAQRVLMFSGNFGADWVIVARDVQPPGSDEYTRNDFVWGEPGIDWDVNNPSQVDLTTVFYNVYESDGSSISGNNRLFYVAVNQGSGYTSRLFDCNLGHFDSFILDGSYIFAGQFNTSRGRTQLHVSYMRNPFNLTRIPSVFSQYSYLVGSHRSSQALVIIEHLVHYSLYLSDETGTFYTLSLVDLVRGSDGATDLEIIDSVNGTMIANQYIDISARRSHTVISFDNGARWNRIASPANDLDGLPINCSLPQCSLNFHLDTSTDYRRLGVYSRDSAPGIIVAHGNRGGFLFDDVSVYISRDGGLTWNQTLDSSWDIEIIDHGGLLVAARDHNQNSSMTIRYSCDEGMSWSDFNFTDAPVTVWGIVTEPGQTTTQVMLFSRDNRRSSWITTHLNFTSIFSRTCGSDDYYPWSVSDGRIGNQTCLLGEERVIERRRSEVCCWNSRQYERVISTSPCQCTAADFECEWGYQRDDSTGECVLNRQYGPQLECLTGYRKIAGDFCIGGVSERFLPPSYCVFNRSDSSDCGAANTGGNTGRNNSNTAVAASVTVIVLLITLGTIIIIILGIAYFVRKRKRITSTGPDELVTMPKEDVVGGEMKFKRLVEDE